MRTYTRRNRPTLASTARKLRIGDLVSNQNRIVITRILITIAIGFVAAIAGGYVCLTLADDTRAIFWLLAVVLVLGFTMAIMALFEGAPPAGFRPSEMSMMEAMRNARQPTWLAFLNPILGVIGVMVGARVRGGVRP